MEEQQTPAQRLLGDFAPKMVQLTDDVLFGDVWKRPGLSPRDRSLVTVAVLGRNLPARPAGQSPAPSPGQRPHPG